MVKVPDYTPNVAQRPAFQQSVTTRASAEDFGAAIGRGMHSVAQGGRMVGSAIQQVQELEDVARAKEADDEFAGWLRERQYGENGFLTLQGKAAVDARSDFENEVAEKRREYSQGLTPGAQSAYGRASQARVNSTLDQSIVHTANQRKKWFTDASTSRINTFQEDALAAFNNPDLVQRNIAAGQAELRQMGQMLGWDIDTLKNEEAEFISGIHKDITLRMSIDDPLAADAYRQEFQEHLTGPHQMQLDNTLSQVVKENFAIREADKIMSEVRSGAGGAAQGLDDAFHANLTAMFEDAPEGMRGNLGVMASNDDKVEIAFNGNPLDDAPKEVQEWVRASASNYGLSLPITQEPWASGNTGVVAAGDTGLAARTLMPSYQQIEVGLSAIADPVIRELTRKRLFAQIETQNKAVAEAAKAAKTDLWKHIEQGLTPDQVPQDVRVAAGLSAVKSAWGFVEDVAKRGKPIDDETLVYDMRRYAAQNPIEFSNIDLNEYRGRVSPGTFKELTSLQTNAMTNDRKAREEGLALTSAFSQSTDALAAVGISTTGLKGSNREDATKRIASFQNVLAAQMSEFKASNDGRNPDQLEIQAMVNRLLLPVVVSEPGWFGSTKETGGKFLFEAGSIGDNQKIDVDVQYAEIPTDMRRSIVSVLESELQRKPSEAEVTTRYEAFVLGE